MLFGILKIGNTYVFHINCHQEISNIQMDLKTHLLQLKATCKRSVTFVKHVILLFRMDIFIDLPPDKQKIHWPQIAHQRPKATT